MYYLIHVHLSPVDEPPEYFAYEVQASTSGKALNLMLAHLDAVANERRVHSIHCSIPYPKSRTDEEWKEGGEDKKPLIRLPQVDVYPAHVVRG